MEQVQLLNGIPNATLVIAGLSLVLIITALVWLRRKKPKLETPVSQSIPVPAKAPEKVQSVFTRKLNELILKTKALDKDFLESLEELLYTGDLGPATVTKLIENVRQKATRQQLSDFEEVKKWLYLEVKEILNSAKVVRADGGAEKSPWVILVVGVNGVGKTTSIGKLAKHYMNLSKSVLVVAGDTFRAAATEQLAVWGERARVEVFQSQQTKDPAAIAFQGLEKALSENIDIVIIDTAGRLHTKENLMEELKKIKKVMTKVVPEAPHEIILVIDAASGQNARVQAKEFDEALGLTSLLVTKLDGTARGGAIVGIADEVGVGVQFIGTGEKIDDLQPFSVDDYAKSLLSL